MKQFLLKILIISSLAIAGIWGFLYYYHCSQIESLDPFYRRFTTGKKPSLLLGSSRVAQGLRPSVFDAMLGGKFAAPFFNYAFTYGTSNIGPTYLKKIKKRISPSNHSMFILEVSPWTMCMPAQNDHLILTEKKTFFGKQITQSMSPNIEYLLFRDDKEQSFFEKIFKPKASIYHLHEDGWLQVNYDITTEESIGNRNWQIHLYGEDSKTKVLSDERFGYLDDMVSYLSSVGTLFLVRLPSSPEMKELETNAYPEFDARVDLIASKYQIPYINLISESGNYQTVDNNHIYKDETEAVSTRICEEILKYMQTSSD